MLDGVLSTDVFGLDIVNHWDRGFDMFRDHEEFHAHCIESDVLHPHTSLKELNGTMKIFILVTYVLQQRTWEGQVMAVKSLVDLSRVGALVIGNRVRENLALFKNRTEVMKGDNGFMIQSHSRECDMKLEKKQDQSGKRQLLSRLSGKWDGTGRYA